MRTSKNSTRNTSSKNANNQQQRKPSSNNLVILTGNLGANAAFFGTNDSAASFRMATKSKVGEKEYVEWLSEAKRDETRQQRLQMSILWLNLQP